MMESLSAVVIGGVNMDVWGRPRTAPVPRDSNPGRVHMRPGGVGRNIAHDLRLLGVDVSLVAPVGADVFGSAIMDSCDELGIDMSMAPVFPDIPSSTYLYMTDEHGDMLFAVNDMDICAAVTGDVLSNLLPSLESFGALVLDANIPQETLELVCSSVSVPIYADPVSSVKAPRLLPVMKYLTAIKPNALEAAALTGEDDPEKAAKALLKMGVKRVYISLSGAGMIAAEGDTLLHIPCETATVINTTGAGDAATAAIVWAELKGLTMEQAARIAMKAGALTCAVDSANSPRLSELAFGR